MDGLEGAAVAGRTSNGGIKVQMRRPRSCTPPFLVGVDSTCPVVCNREFAFYLGEFVRGGHGEAVRQALWGLVRGNEESKDGTEGEQAEPSR